MKPVCPPRWVKSSKISCCRSLAPVRRQICGESLRQRMLHNGHIFLPGDMRPLDSIGWNALLPSCFETPPLSLCALAWGRSEALTYNCNTGVSLRGYYGAYQMKFGAVAVALACMATGSGAQEATMVIRAVSQANVLRAGTPVMLKTMRELTTKGKHLKVGDRFPLEVSESVLLNG